MEDMDKMEMKRREMKRKMERKARKASEESKDVYMPPAMSSEERKSLQEMMKMDNVKGYKKGGMVTRGQGAVMRKKSCKMC
jgi:hypothetical protein